MYLIRFGFSVGKLIVTKKVGQEILPGLEDMEEITEIYKNPYGKNEENDSFEKQQNTNVYVSLVRRSPYRMSTTPTYVTARTMKHGERYINI